MKKFNCILLVDDDDISNFVTQQILEELEIANHAHIAKNGKEALEFIEGNCQEEVSFEDQCPQVVLLDINMPVMNGFEFLNELEKLDRGLDEKIGVYVLTSSSNPKDIETARKFNIKGFINKPLTPDKLQSHFN